MSTGTANKTQQDCSGDVEHTDYLWGASEKSVGRC